MNVSKMIGWILTGLFVLLFAALSGSSKFLATDNIAKDLNIEKSTIIVIGVIEVICAILFAIPRTAFLGAILLTGYMGGAIMVHVGKGELPIAQVVIAILVWVALGLRQPEIFQMALGNPIHPDPADEPKPAM